MAFGNVASADNPTVDSTPQDLWFTYTERSVLTVRTFEIQGAFSDPMLWLYNSDGQLLASNDDWFGLQSHIEWQVAPGSYRVRAGFCCGNPDATRQGQRYEVGTSITPVPTTVETSTSLQVSTTVMPDTSPVSTTAIQETSTSTTTTVPQTTTTQEPTTTTQSVAPSTTDPVPSSSDQPSTSLPPTTLQESTTTSDAPSTTLPVSEPIPTDPVSETIPPSVVSTSTVTVTTLPPKPQATTPPQTSTTTPTMPPVTSTIVTPLTTAPPETLETTTTTLTEILPTTPDAVADAVQQADTPAERAALTAQLNTASDDVKQTFEATVNVYSGQWDNYIPAGSRIPVGERRTLIAVMGGLVSLASTAPRRKK